MKRYRVLRSLKFFVVAVVAMTVVGFAIMSLWNWLLPPLVGWHSISLIQALGLFLLCRLLFGGWRGRRWGWKQRMRDRWAGMTPEERERVRSNWQRRYACGRGAAEKTA